jgi:hypothetical protein
MREAGLTLWNARLVGGRGSGPVERSVVRVVGDQVEAIESVKGPQPPPGAWAERGERRA